MDFLYLLLFFGLAGYALLIKSWFKKKKVYEESYFNLSLLPDFPNSCKLYFEEKLGRDCKRCSSGGKKSGLTIRKRFQLSKTKDGILTVKALTHIFQCDTCGYKGLQLSDNKNIRVD